MVDVLRAEWRPKMSWGEIIALRDQVYDMLTDIRQSRNIQPVTTSKLCPCCDKPMVLGASGVSVRAMIFSLKRFGIADEADVKLLEKGWNKHRRETGLDLNGKAPHNNGMDPTGRAALD